MAQESKNENRKQRIREAFHDGKQVERMPAREDMAPQHSDDVIYRVAPVLPSQYDVRNAGREF